MPRKPWRKQSSWLQKASRTTQIRVSLCECHRSAPRMYSSRSGQMTGNRKLPPCGCSARPVTRRWFEDEACGYPQVLIPFGSLSNCISTLTQLKNRKLDFQRSSELQRVRGHRLEGKTKCSTLCRL